MKLCYFDDWKLGVVKGDTVVDVSAVVKGIPHTNPANLINGLIERFSDYRRQLEDAAAKGQGVPLARSSCARPCRSPPTSTAWRSTTWKTARAPSRRRSTASTNPATPSSARTTP